MNNNPFIGDDHTDNLIKLLDRQFDKSISIIENSLIHFSNVSIHDLLFLRAYVEEIIRKEQFILDRTLKESKDMGGIQNHPKSEQYSSKHKYVFVKRGQLSAINTLITIKVSEIDISQLGEKFMEIAKGYLNKNDYEAILELANEH